ncbi:MAG: 1-acyl-sn-glycerol-3-phosphate acyltransferase [Bacteroidota bacterium]
MPRWFAKFMLRILGMKVVDHNDEWPAKAVVAVAPHTSSRDFPYGLYSRAVIRQDIKFVGKASLFKGAVGPILKWLGGVPVDRSKRNNFTDAVADIFRQRDNFLICLAIEGTRKKVDRFKTGFYYIAKAAEVPIVLVRFDFGKGNIEFSKPYWPTEDMRADFDFFYRHFDGVKGINPAGSFDYNPEVALEGF